MKFTSFGSENQHLKILEARIETFRICVGLIQIIMEVQGPIRKLQHQSERFGPKKKRIKFRQKLERSKQYDNMEIWTTCNNKNVEGLNWILMKNERTKIDEMKSQRAEINNARKFKDLMCNLISKLKDSKIG